jgi:hypothetical protein
MYINQKNIISVAIVIIIVIFNLTQYDIMFLVTCTKN